MLRLLIAEDELMELEYLESFVRRNFKDSVEIVAVCTEGADALQRGRELSPDAVFLDINMPKVNGLDVARELKAENPYLIVVILTAYGTFTYAKEAISIGVSNYLVKPYKDEELYSTIMDVINAHSSDARKEMERLVTHISNSSKANDRQHPVVTKVLSYIEKHYAEKITLEIMSDDIGFSSSYVSKCINNNLGKSFNSLLLEYRCARAVDLLRTGKRIKVVAFETGFSDADYFIRCFKNQMGCTPKAYLKALESLEDK